GTIQQKEEEKEVGMYQKKVNDFSNLLKNHEFTSNVFAFLESQTIPNVWYKQFSLNLKNREVQISGESDDMEALSSQISVFENERNVKYIKNIGTLNSSLGDSARITFSTNLLLTQNIFAYVSELEPLSQTTSPATQSPVTNNTTPPVTPETGTETPATPPVAPPVAPPVTVAPENTVVKSSEKLITSFRLNLKPEVVGVIDQTKYTITLTVPSGTNLKNLISVIALSKGATVLPASKVSQDFTSPVTYKVAAEYGSIQAYQVKVVVAAPLPLAEETKQSDNTLIIILMFVGIGIAVVAAIGLLIWKKMSGPKNT
ncbi:MAG: DUF5018 domain-containing protein, partial [Candidatus Staskawiczbacteria bacterium]